MAQGQYFTGDRQVLHHTFNAVIGPGENMRGGFAAAGEPTVAFDNPEQNLANPNPSRAVGRGDQSWDEMFLGQVYYKVVDQRRYLISAN